MPAEKKLVEKVTVPATKLRDGCGKWQRLPTCSSLEKMEDIDTDEDNSSNLPVHVHETDHRSRRRRRRKEEKEEEKDGEDATQKGARDVDITACSMKEQSISEERPESEITAKSEILPHPIQGHKKTRAENKLLS